VAKLTKKPTVPRTKRHKHQVGQMGQKTGKKSGSVANFPKETPKESGK